MRIVYLFLALLYTLLMLPFSVGAQSRDEFKPEIYVQDKDTLRYRILYPKKFDRNKKYPLLLFLHGAGERGNDNKAQLTHGADLFLQEEVREKFPAVVLFPQASKETYWASVEVDREVKPFRFKFKKEEGPTTPLQLVMALLNSITAEDFIDPNRIYVGGLSMGAMGTYEVIYHQPQIFAAAFAICGGADTSITESYPDGFNIWIFHGQQDDIVPPALSIGMARMINHYGGNAKLSLYPNDNHNSWDSALAEPNLLPWLFSQEKNAR